MGHHMIDRQATILLLVAVWTFLLLPLAPLWAYDGRLSPVDRISPKIDHKPMNKTIDDGKPLAITAVITDNDAIRNVMLFYRSATGIKFVETKMEAIGDGLYRGVIPAADISKSDSPIEYYIGAIDKAGNVTIQGLPSEPMMVVVKVLPMTSGKEIMPEEKTVKEPVVPPAKEVVPEEEIVQVPVVPPVVVVPEEKGVPPALEGLTTKTEAKKVAAPFYKKWWFWSLAALVVVAIVVNRDPEPSRGTLVVEVPAP